jgi:Zn-dependent protease with chaperone function
VSERRQERADRHATSLHATVTGTGDELHPSQARPLAVALSVLVIVSTWLLVVPAVWLMVAIPFRLAGILLGVLVLAIWWSVLPRRPHLPDDARLVVGATPELDGLLATVAGAVGTSPPRTVAVTPWINAAVLDGVRGAGRTLLIGAPLWLALSPQARVALLAHELGHYSSGDTRRGRVTGAAFTSLRRWQELLDDPIGGRRSGGYDYNPRPEGSLVTVSMWGARGVIWLVGLIPLLLSWALVHLTSRDSQRAEYRADRAAATTAGPDALREVLVVLQRLDALDSALQRASHANRSTLDAAREFRVDELPPATGPGHHHRPEPFDSHPPLPLRLDALTHVAATASVVLDSGTAAAIDSELASAFVKVEPDVRDQYR